MVNNPHPEKKEERGGKGRVKGGKEEKITKKKDILAGRGGGGQKYGYPYQYTPLIPGSIGGCAGTLISFPFDVIRTRVVAQPESNKMYKSTLDAAVHLHREGGLRAFYKGNNTLNNTLNGNLFDPHIDPDPESM